MIEYVSEAVIALGGNLPSEAGSPADTLVAAIAAMPAKGLAVRAVSRFFATPCFPAGTGPDYVNAAVRVVTDLEPAAILQALHGIENRYGRERQERWGMRTLDLDLLAVGDCILPDIATQTHWRSLPPEAQIRAAPDRLVLPHPRLQDRGFVLVPMNDIAPGWVHPILGKPVSALVSALPDAEIAGIRPL